MSWIADLLKIGAGSTPGGAGAEIAEGAAKGILGGVGDLAIKVRQVITGEVDPATKAKLVEIAVQAEALQQQGTNAINLEDAKQGKFFQSGWRPNLGWACGCAFWYTYLVQPFLIFVIQAVVWLHATPGTPFPQPPSLNMTDVMGLLGGLLGMGTLRSVEKIRGLTK